MRNLKRPFAKNIMFASAVALLFSGSTLLAQDPPDKTPEAVYAVGNGVTAPKATYAPNPPYVEKARKAKISGLVVLSMIVTAEGKVRDVKVTKSLDEGLDKQAVETVRTWKFEPAIKDGKAVAVHLSTDVTFKLY
jgi:protein TonB